MSFGYTSVKKLMEQLQDMKGKQFGYGYFRYTDREIKENELTIDVLTILEYLESEEITNGVAWDIEEECEMEMHISDYIDLGLEEGWIEEVNSGNSYNWCSPLNHDFNYEIYKDDNRDMFLVKFRVHLFGDMRNVGGYSDWVHFEFQYEDNFFELLMDCEKYFEVEFENNKYCIEINPLSDEIRLEIIDNGDYDELWGDEKYEILNKMEELEIITY